MDQYVLTNFRPCVTKKNWRMDCGVAGYDNHPIAAVRIVPIGKQLVGQRHTGRYRAQAGYGHGQAHLPVHLAGARIVRAHDVVQTRRALALADAVRRA